MDLNFGNAHSWVPADTRRASGRIMARKASRIIVIFVLGGPLLFVLLYSLLERSYGDNVAASAFLDLRFNLTYEEVAARVGPAARRESAKPGSEVYEWILVNGKVKRLMFVDNRLKYILAPQGPTARRSARGH